MGYKNKPFILYIFFFFVLLCSQWITSVFAQDGIDAIDSTAGEGIVVVEKKGYFIKKTDEGFVFIQKLTWDKVAYVLRYDIVIEKQNEKGQWEPFDIISTTVNTLEVSYFAGKYRYKILVYNLLDILELESQWFEIIILRATQPQIKDFSPKLIYLDEENTGIFKMKGENLAEDTIYTLEIPGVQKRTITGIIVKKDDKNEDVEVQFDIDAIDTGNYTLVAKNPGGFTAENSSSVVKYSKPYDLNVTIGYSPSLIAPTGNISSYFDNFFLPLGFSARVTYIPLKKRFGYFGVELTAYWFRLGKELDGYDIALDIFPVNLNFVYQLPIIKKRLILDTHVGGGLTYFNNLELNFNNSVTSDTLDAMGFSINAGVALQIYIIKRLYAEISVDYIIALPKNTIFQMILPSASVGWQF